METGGSCAGHRGGEAAGLCWERCHKSLHRGSTARLGDVLELCRQRPAKPTPVWGDAETINKQSSLQAASAARHREHGPAAPSPSVRHHLCVLCSPAFLIPPHPAREQSPPLTLRCPNVLSAGKMNLSHSHTQILKLTFQLHTGLT